MKTTLSQDARAVARILLIYKKTGFPIFAGNCSHISNGALDAAGILDRPVPNILPGSAGERATVAGGVIYLVPKGIISMPGGVI